MDKGPTILSLGERSPGQGSQFSGSQLGDDLLSWRECGSPVETTQQSKESPLILEGKGAAVEETKKGGSQAL